MKKLLMLAALVTATTLGASMTNKAQADHRSYYRSRPGFGVSVGYGARYRGGFSYYSAVPRSTYFYNTRVPRYVSPYRGGFYGTPAYRPVYGGGLYRGGYCW